MSNFYTNKYILWVFKSHNRIYINKIQKNIKLMNEQILWFSYFLICLNPNVTQNLDTIDNFKCNFSRTMKDNDHQLSILRLNEIVDPLNSTI